MDHDEVGPPLHAGLDPEVRHERRMEIESDIWEQTHGPGRSAGGHVLWRCLAGAPADLSWRMEQARAGAALAAMALAALGGAEASGAWLARSGLPRLVTLMAWLYMIVGALLVLTLPLNRNPDPGGVAFFGGWCVVGGSLMWWGHGAIRRRPWPGAGAVLLGCLPIGVALWMTVAVPILTVAVAGMLCGKLRR